MNIPFIDLKSQFYKIEGQLHDAINAVLEHGVYINGPEVLELERKLSEHTKAKHSITCGNGTDALTIALLALDLDSEDAVFVPSFTYIASAEAIALVGATPYFVDVADDYNICPHSLSTAINDAINNKHQPKVVIPVDLFGKPSIRSELDELVKKYELKVIYDAAQSFGSSHGGKKIGNFGDITTTSFFPAKPLGCYGDGGAIFTNDDHLADLMSSIKNHGMGSHKYEHVNIGLNSRLDTLQAAILNQKIELLDLEIKQRNEVAEKYNKGLEDSELILPTLSPEKNYAWAQYTIRHKRRDLIIQELRKRNIPTAIYYPIPLNKQEAYINSFVVSSGLQKTESFCAEVFSLPMSPYLKDSDQLYIIENLLEVLSSYG